MQHAAKPLHGNPGLPFSCCLFAYWDTGRNAGKVAVVDLYRSPLGRGKWERGEGDSVCAPASFACHAAGTVLYARFFCSYSL
jgi:hypothetical protein